MKDIAPRRFQFSLETLFAILTFVAVLAALPRIGSGFVAVGCFLLIWAIAVFRPESLAHWSRRDLKSIVICVVVAVSVLGAVCTLALIIEVSISSWREEKDYRNGNATIQISWPIIRALDQYRAANGNYPDTLEALVPPHLPSIPPPMLGKQWDYRTSDKGQHFYLEFRSPHKFPVFWYRSEDDGWSSDSG